MSRRWKHLLNSSRSTTSSSRSDSSRKRKRDRIKALFSRPMKEESVSKVVSKVKAREELRSSAAAQQNKQAPATTAARIDEFDVFPTSTKERNSSGRSSGEKAMKSKPAVVGKPEAKLGGEYIPGTKFKLCKNKDNGGRLLDENGVPFWSAHSKAPKNSEEEEEPTEEDLPMNAEVLLDVQNGTRKLVEVPEGKVEMDPFAELEKLMARDRKYFTVEQIFSNTVRTMVNVNDEVDTDERSEKRRSSKKVIVEEPSTVILYNYDNRTYFKKEPFKKTNLADVKSEDA